MTSESEQPTAQSPKDGLPPAGGGWPLIDGWARATLSPQGPGIWQGLLHKSACLACAWGTGGEKGGFTNELGESIQRCLKSVQAVESELLPAVPAEVFAGRSLAQLQQLSSRQADRLGRLSHPMLLRQGASHYERIGWDDVFELAEAAFRCPPERLASYSSGRSSNEAAYLLQLLIRALGSSNLADCSDLCHAPSTVGLKQVFGSGTSMVSLESLRQADCVVLVGSNPPANHPRFMNELILLRERGGSVIVINPVLEGGLLKFGSPSFPIRSLLQGSDIASLFLQPVPGSDTAVFVGLQKALLELGAVAWDSLEAQSEGWQEVVEQARGTGWDAITSCCGLSREELTAAARVIAQSQGVVFAWAMGITHHSNGTDNVRAIANTAVLSGNVGRPGAGTMPIRGHSNVQGAGSMGVTVKLRDDLRQALEQLLGRPLSRVPGYDTRALIEAAEDGRVDTLLCLGGNLFSANPDQAQARRALGRIDTIMYLATKPNLGHFHGLAARQTLVLPVCNRMEMPHTTTVESGNNYVRLNETGQTHLRGAELISEVTFLAELAGRLLGSDPIDWRGLQDTTYVRQLIARTVPGYAQVAAIEKTDGEFTVEGRVFSTPKFPTPSGRAQLAPTPLPLLSLPQPADLGGLEPGQPGVVLALITARSYGQHNTVVYQEGDRYRQMPHRQCILMNTGDIARAGLQPHQRVVVQGEAGLMEGIEIIPGAIKEGAGLMFYPEVNVLMRGHHDPQSGTPAYKRVPVLVRG